MDSGYQIPTLSDKQNLIKHVQFSTQQHDELVSQFNTINVCPMSQETDGPPLKAVIIKESIAEFN